MAKAPIKFQDIFNNLSPLSAEDQTSIDCLSQCLSETIKTQDRSLTSNCAFLGFRKSRGLSLKYTRQACHYAIQSLSKCRFVATSNFLSYRNDRWKDNAPSDVFEPFLNFLISDDTFGKAIVNKDPEFIRNTGFVIRADIPTQVLQLLLVGTRHFIECSTDCFLKFNELTSKGVPPWVAYVSTFGTWLSGAKYRAKDIVGPYSAHRMFPCSLEPSSLKNLISGDIVNKVNGTLEGGNSKYGGCSNLFGNSCGFSRPFMFHLLSNNAGLRKALSDFRKVNEKGFSSVPDPFSGKTDARILDPLKFTYKEFYEILLPFSVENSLI